MEKIFWLGNPYFAADLENCGWNEVFIHTPEKLKPYTWQDILKLANFIPDLVVLGDSSLPPYLLGVEDFPCPTIFYSVDSPIHSWHPLYAQAFDACLVSLYNHLPNYQGPFLPKERIWWSPPFAKNEDRPNPTIKPSVDCLFVGTINDKLMPKRSAFLNSLKKYIPDLEITSGNYRDLFPRGRVLINYCEHEDLNFRVFEAMACGGCLVTPRINNGLDKLFVDGEEMVAYAPDDAGDAAYRIQFLLDNPDLREYIAKTALEKVNSEHRSIHRAQAFTDHLCDLAMDDLSGLVYKRRSQAEKIRSQCLAGPYSHWAEELADEEMKKAYLQAARGELSR